MADPNPELIERATLALVNSRRARRGLSPIDRMPWAGTSDMERRHVAAALNAVADDLRAEGAAEALHAAIYDLEITKSNHDVAEYAAPVPGEVGRQDAIDEWISICEEPVEWMWKFAQRYVHEAPSGAYIREVEEEARAEGAAEVFNALRMLRDEADEPLAVDLGNMVRAWLDEREGISHG